jgi:hypothetical protein
MGLPYKTLIFTSSEAKAKKALEELSVSGTSINITVATEETLKFLHFD